MPQTNPIGVRSSGPLLKTGLFDKRHKTYIHLSYYSIAVNYTFPLLNCWHALECASYITTALLPFIKQFLCGVGHATSLFPGPRRPYTVSNCYVCAIIHERSTIAREHRIIRLCNELFKQHYDMLGIVVAVHCLTLFISLTSTARHPPYDLHTCPFGEFITRIH